MHDYSIMFVDQDAIEVVWNVTFSVQTLAKHFFSTLMSVSSEFNMTDTEDNINWQHDMVQRMRESPRFFGPYKCSQCYILRGYQGT